jgi:hypothetical protein
MVIDPTIETRITGRSLLSAVLVVGMTLTFVSSASAKTLKLNWVEQRSKTYYPTTPMTFKVKDVVTVGPKWSVHAAFTNRSTVPIRIRRTLGNYYAPFDFGLTWAHGGGGLDQLRYSFAKPALPKQLRPGQTWSGVFGGRGRPKDLLISVASGPSSRRTHRRPSRNSTGSRNITSRSKGTFARGTR